MATQFRIVDIVVIRTLYKPAGVGETLSLAVRPSRHYTQVLHSEFWPVITKCERQRVGTIGRAHAALSSAVFGLNFDAAARIEFVPDARELADSGSVAQSVERFAL
ncbi:MAG: hypothetical protein WBE69_22015 [Candidatus Binataceae bacterium]|jgi:hypothetical protein